ncbi:hypothetical protein PIB30_027745 [Stylosanthes scabra]|uniref:Uncharacterized protein n=1 Tax=Stylosanthes scabra TaxID=79078 RepID=A0ABU6XCA3_9FABA|nr:hypothetical protein [Stylosanthes scabra]
MEAVKALINANDIDDISLLDNATIVAAIFIQQVSRQFNHGRFAQSRCAIVPLLLVVLLLLLLLYCGGGGGEVVELVVVVVVVVRLVMIRGLGLWTLARNSTPTRETKFLGLSSEELWPLFPGTSS